jgi:hypothetical protein
MSLLTDVVISSTQTADMMIHEEEQIVLMFDEHRCSYQLLAWHFCQRRSDGTDRSLTILVRENSAGNAWIGTLTTLIDDQGLLWINNLDHRRHRLRSSEHSDSIISHFEIEETIDARVSVETMCGSLLIISIRLMPHASASVLERVLIFHLYLQLSHWCSTHPPVLLLSRSRLALLFTQPPLARRSY